MLIGRLLPSRINVAVKSQPAMYVDLIQHVHGRSKILSKAGYVNANAEMFHKHKTVLRSVLCHWQRCMSALCPNGPNKSQMALYFSGAVQWRHP